MALQCKLLLLDYRITDVEVELRESDIIQTAGYPMLLEPTDIINPTAILHEPLTISLVITTCAQNSQWVKGTAGFFLGVLGIKKLLLGHRPSRPLPLVSV